MLGLIYRANNGDVYRQVSKTTARRLFDSNVPVLALPSNIRPNNPWMAPCEFNKNKYCDPTFDIACNSFAYYNCNNEMGNYIHFFAK